MGKLSGRDIFLYPEIKKFSRKKFFYTFDMFEHKNMF